MTTNDRVFYLIFTGIVVFVVLMIFLAWKYPEEPYIENETNILLMIPVH
jgi:hypothetical protein